MMHSPSTRNTKVVALHLPKRNQQVMESVWWPIGHGLGARGHWVGDTRRNLLNSFLASHSSLTTFCQRGDQSKFEQVCSTISTSQGSVGQLGLVNIFTHLIVWIIYDGQGRRKREEKRDKTLGPSGSPGILRDDRWSCKKNVFNP